MLLVRDANNNGAIDSGEIIDRSRNQFARQITCQNLTAGDYFVIIRNRQFNAAKVQYRVTADARV